MCVHLSYSWFSVDFFILWRGGQLTGWFLSSKETVLFIMASSLLSVAPPLSWVSHSLERFEHCHLGSHVIFVRYNMSVFGGTGKRGDHRYPTVPLCEYCNMLGCSKTHFRNPYSRVFCSLGIIFPSLSSWKDLKWRFGKGLSLRTWIAAADWSRQHWVTRNNVLILYKVVSYVLPISSRLKGYLEWTASVVYG